MFYQYIFTTKTLQTTSTKPFLLLIFRFVEHKSVTIFNVHIVWFITINQKQQIHWVFKFFTQNINWKNQPIFVTKRVNANIVFYVNLVKIFFFHRKLNSTTIKIFSNFFVDFLNSSWVFFWRINMPNIALWKTFLIFVFYVD